MSFDLSVIPNKNILLAVTGGIAAYKSAELVRRLKDEGAEVRVVMTRGGCQFVTPMTFQALSGNPVHTALLDSDAEAAMGHIELARWADVILIAPASANTLARIAMGMADDLLSTLCLASRAPIGLAPAMNQQMWANAATQANVATLQQRGYQVFGPASGEQACGDVGEGRMLEPQQLLQQLIELFNTEQPMAGLKVMITAGPTYEAIDPVRFIGNHSSGKMGFAIAKAAANLGAEVFLISGPSHQKINHSLVHRIDVVSADEMYKAAHQYYKDIDIAILSAAVADYTPKNVAYQKIKKKDATLEIQLSPTKDILASLGEIKTNQYLVGFALETNNELENAKSKLKRKNLDAIVLNSLQDKGAGFATDTNKITIIDASLNQKSFELKSKVEVAKDIMNAVVLNSIKEDKSIDTIHIIDFDMWIMALTTAFLIALPLLKIRIGQPFGMLLVVLYGAYTYATITL